MADNDNGERAAEILRRLFPRNTAAEMATPCPKCGELPARHRKTISHQTFWLGCPKKS